MLGHVVAGRVLARLPNPDGELVGLGRNVEADPAGNVAHARPGADPTGFAAEGHPLPLHRVKAHAERGRLLAGHLADVGLLLARRHRPTPPDSPRKGIPCRSTASRLMRSAAVFWRATSRT